MQMRAERWVESAAVHGEIRQAEPDYELDEGAGGRSGGGEDVARLRVGSRLHALTGRGLRCVLARSVPWRVSRLCGGRVWAGSRAAYLRTAPVKETDLAHVAVLKQFSGFFFSSGLYIQYSWTDAIPYTPITVYG